MVRRSGQFGKQVKELFKNALQRGFKASIVDTARGSEVTYQEHWDEENLDHIEVYAEAVLDENSALWETKARREAAQVAAALNTQPVPDGTAPSGHNQCSPTWSE